VRADVDGRRLLVGSARLLEGAGVEPVGLSEQAAALSGQGKTAMLVASATRSPRHPPAEPSPSRSAPGATRLRPR
jgi:hypothetical protein